jgi:hypothetical protein
MALFHPSTLRAARLCAALLAAAASAAAAPIAQTSFETELAVPGAYTDPGDPATDHDLTNHAAEPLVDSTAASAVGGELAFDARYVNSRGSVGQSDGDEIGVSADASAVGAYSDGAQGYHLSDADGTAVLEFAPVDLSLPGVVIQVDLFVREADWEPDDRVRVIADLDGAPDVVLLDTSGAGIDELSIEGRWRRLGAAIPDAASSARIRVELESDQAAEAVFVDRVNVLPEAGIAGLLAGALLVGALARRPRR